MTILTSRLWGMLSAGLLDARAVLARAGHFRVVLERHSSPASPAPWGNVHHGEMFTYEHFVFYFPKSKEKSAFHIL